MHATCVDDLPVHVRAKTFLTAVFGLTRGFDSDLWLAVQLDESAESIVSNIAEGFEQKSDRAFARYLEISAGSAEESRAHLNAAALRGHAPARCAELAAEAREIAHMLRGFVRYLRRCDRKIRFPP